MENKIQQKNNDDRATFASYATGFVLSLALTLAAYFIVSIHVNSGRTIISSTVLICAILVLAVAQLCVQLVFFMHLGRGDGSGWRLGIFISTVGIILIVVVGSIWIMNHLNYNMMASPDQMNAYIQSQDGF